MVGVEAGHFGAHPPQAFDQRLSVGLVDHGHKGQSAAQRGQALRLAVPVKGRAVLRMVHSRTQTPPHGARYGHLLIDNQPSHHLASARAKDVGLGRIKGQVDLREGALGQSQQAQSRVVAREGDVVGVAGVAHAFALGAVVQDLVGSAQHEIEQGRAGRCAHGQRAAGGTQVQQQADGRGRESVAEFTPQGGQHQGPAHTGKAVADVGVDHHGPAHMRLGVVHDGPARHKAAGGWVCAQRREQLVEDEALCVAQERVRRADHARATGFFGDVMFGVSAIELAACAVSATTHGQRLHQTRRCLDSQVGE